MKNLLILELFFFTSTYFNQVQARIIVLTIIQCDKNGCDTFQHAYNAEDCEQASYMAMRTFGNQIAVNCPGMGVPNNSPYAVLRFFSMFNSL